MQRDTTLEAFREKVIETGYIYIYSKALLTAVKLDLFNLIGKEARSPIELAKATGCSEHGVELLLKALVGMGFLKKKTNLYSNTSYGREVFLKEKQLYLGDILSFHNLMWEGWNHLEESVRTGRPIREPDMFQKEREETRAFILAMHNTAMGHAESLAKMVSLKGAKRLIDIGGGSGAYSIFFCKTNPGLKATILDLPATLEVTKEIVSLFGMTHRIELLRGDYNENLPTGYDVAFLSHIIHSVGEEGNRALMRRVYGALNPGGKIIIQDFILNKDTATPAFASTFALNMLLFTEKGRTYSFEEIKGWLRAAGFKAITWPTRPKRTMPRDISIVMAKK
jgi:precorrin-6B methylase 2